MHLNLLDVPTKKEFDDFDSDSQESDDFEVLDELQ